MSRVFNFSAGPATLPEAVLQQAADEMLDWHGSGMSVMEMSHRGGEFTDIITAAESDLRELMAIPDQYKVLFLQGGASLQFSMVPLNLAGSDDCADYINTGSWSKKAIAEAERYCTVHVAGSSADDNFTWIPTQEQCQLNADAAYCHITTNNTIFGTEYHELPDTGQVPLVADMSSNILSKPIEVSRFGLIYAGAQKNIGPSGLTVVIVREELIGRARDGVPAMLDYKTHADAGSCYNTPPTYGIYIAGLVFKYLKGQGGLKAIQEVNRRKAAKLYQAIDEDDFYNSPVRRQDRSTMNVPFTLANPELDKTFLEQAEGKGLVNLKGHRSVGGMRASIYNAMPEDGINALIEFMKDFSRRYG
jgi:phosphoserine aminotransferase